MARRKVKPFNPDLFGEIRTPPPRLFPYKPKRKGDTIPFPEAKDPTGAAGRAIGFLAGFNIPEGRRQGKAIEGDDLPPFIRRAIIDLIGHRDPETHTRYIRNAFFCAPRKSMKSYLSALLGVLFLFSEQEYAGEILIVAASQRQARRIFELTCAIIRSNPARWGSLRVQDVSARLTNLKTGTTLSAMPAEPSKLYGMSPSVLLLDELHVWAGTKGHRLWTSLVTGQGARPNPLTVVTSTVPDDRPSEGDVFLEQLRYAESVASGDTDDRRYLPMLWLTPEDADIADPEVWERYNPGAHYSISLDEMKEEFEKARTTETGLLGFRTMRLNQIATSSLDAGWLSPKMLEKITSDVPVDPEVLASASNLAIGLDYGGGFDLASLVVVGDDGFGGMTAIQRSWICRAGFDRIASSAPEVKAMVNRGELTISGDEAVTAETVIAEVADLASYFGVTEIALDPAMSQHLAPGLTEAGLAIVEARQGTTTMAAPMQLLEEQIAQGLFSIGDDQLFLWCLGNTAQQTNNMGRKPIKIGNDSSDNPRKIDATSALLSALQLIQEARIVGDSATDDRIWICPWTDPVNAQAVLDGGSYMSGFGLPDKIHPVTKGKIVYG